MEAPYQQQKEENTLLSEKSKEPSLGHLLEVSQTEALKLRLKIAELTRDNEELRGSKLPSTDRSGPGKTEVQGFFVTTGSKNPGSSSAIGEEQNEQVMFLQTDPRPPSSGSSSEFELVPPIEKKTPDSQKSGSSSEFEVVTPTEKSPDSQKSDLAQQLQNEDINVSFHLQRLENILSMFAKESDTTQLLNPLGMMFLEFSRLSNKVQKIEQRTAILQTLCEQLRKENEDLRKKLESDLEQRNLAIEQLRHENTELKKMVTTDTKEPLMLEGGDLLQSCKVIEKQQLPRSKPVTDIYEKKIKELEHQRVELLEVNKQWDRQFRAMKQLYEQKITELRQRLADSQKVVSELETEREQKQRDFDRKLLLAKSKIENEEAEKERLVLEANELKQKGKYLQDQIAPLNKQREYQEKEIYRLNKALEQALNMQAAAPQAPVFGNPDDTGMSVRRQELLTQIDVLNHQVKIFEEDFLKERSDRERMNEEKEELKKELKKMQSKITVLNTQLQVYQDDYQKEKEEKEKLQRLLKQQKQGQEERRPSDPQPGAVGPVCPPYQPLSPPILHPMYHRYEDWPVRYPPTAVPDAQVPNRNFMNMPPPEYTWHPPIPPLRNPPLQGVDPSRQICKESEPVTPVMGKTQR